MRKRVKYATVGLVAVLIGPAATAQTPGSRWALAPYACDGELDKRFDTPLLVEPMSVRWFNANCTIVSSYRVKNAWFLQGRCTEEGKVSTIPIMLDWQGDRLRVGWNREPVIEMQRCRP